MTLARVPGQGIIAKNMKEEKNHADRLTVIALPKPKQELFYIKYS
jgi:hypothetical protein